MTGPADGSRSSHRNGATAPEQAAVPERSPRLSARPRTSRWLRGAAVGLALVLFLAGCNSADDDEGSGGGDGGGGGAAGELACSDTPPDVEGDPKPVKLQLQWSTQAQFGGYFAAVDQGLYEKHGLDVEIVEGGVDIVPQAQLAEGEVDFALAWVPKALQSRESDANITNISQVFQRSGTLQVSWADSDIESAADFKDRKVGNWGFGNEFELFAGMTEAGLDPSSDVELVQQQFDMQALLNKEIDAAQAMTYNEYAQVLEAVNPETGQLYQPEDFSVIDWNEEGTAMLQDAIWADTEKLQDDQEYCDTAVRFVAASLEGWAFCRDNVDACVESVLEAGSQLGESHQAWQMNEINKLIWPSPDEGVGTMDQELWDRTVEISLETKNADGTTVLGEEPSSDAWTPEINAAAVELLKADAIDVVGTDYEPVDVELREGGE